MIPYQTDRALARPSLPAYRPQPSSPPQLRQSSHLLLDWSPATVIGRLHDRHIERPTAPCPASGSGSMPASVSSFTTLSSTGLTLMLPAAACAYENPKQHVFHQKGQRVGGPPLKRAHMVSRNS